MAAEIESGICVSVAGLPSATSSEPQASTATSCRLQTGGAHMIGHPRQGEVHRAEATTSIKQHVAFFEIYSGGAHMMGLFFLRCFLHRGDEHTCVRDRHIALCIVRHIVQRTGQCQGTPHKVHRSCSR